MPIAALIVAIFVFVGGRMLLGNVIVGTSDSDLIILNIAPLALAGIVLGIVVAVFRR